MVYTLPRAIKEEKKNEERVGFSHIADERDKEKESKLRKKKAVSVFFSFFYILSTERFFGRG